MDKIHLKLEAVEESDDQLANVSYNVQQALVDRTLEADNISQAVLLFLWRRKINLFSMVKLFGYSLSLL